MVAAAQRNPDAQARAINFAAAYLTHHAPEFLTDGWSMRVFVGSCPACDEWGAWFDLNLFLPVRTPLVKREHPNAPWRNCCPSCSNVYPWPDPVGVKVTGSQVRQKTSQ